MVPHRILPVVALALCACGSDLVIKPQTLPNGAQGLPYHAQLDSTGDHPIAWKLEDGQLPPGLSLDGNGAIDGTPSVPGSFLFTIKSTDAGTVHHNDGHQPFTVVILPKLVPDGTIPPAQVGASYQHTVSATGGVAPYTIDVKGLPAHFHYDASSATISGNPTFSGAYPLEFDVSDSGHPGQSAVGHATLIIKPVKVSVSTASLPAPSLNTPYYATLAAQDGSGNFSWSIVDGALPDGLSLSTAGAITGTPTRASSFTFTVQVADLDSPPDTASQAFTLRVQ